MYLFFIILQFAHGNEDLLVDFNPTFHFRYKSRVSIFNYILVFFFLIHVSLVYLTNS